MFNLIEIFNKALLLREAVDPNKIEQAIDTKKRVIINYEGDPEHGIAPGTRYIDVYSYILTTAGNQAIRAYQPMGDTASDVPSWKLFRLDRIKSWKETPYINKVPAQGFNRFEDKGAKEVFKIADYSKYNTNGLKNTKQAPLNEPELFKTNTEKGIENLKQQLQNPQKINIEPNKKNNINVGEPKPIEPIKSKIAEPNVSLSSEKTNEPEIYKTETEKNMEKLKKQLENPKNIKDINPNFKSF
jgi:hypothetical protein